MPAPANDLFANRISLAASDTIALGSTAEATLESGEDYYPYDGITVWYEWTAPNDGLLRIAAVAPNPSQTVYVYRASVAGVGVMPASNEPVAWPEGTSGADVLVPCSAGEIFYLQVEAATSIEVTVERISPSVGSWQINANMGAWVWEVGPIAADRPSMLPTPPAYVFPAECGEIDYFTMPDRGLAATANWGERWYDSYRYRSGGGFNNSGPDTIDWPDQILYVVYYNLGYDDPSTYTPPVVGSDLVHRTVAIGGTAPDPPAPPANDSFANRILLSTSTPSVVVTTTNAALELGETYYPADATTIWYEWTAPADGLFKVNFRNSGLGAAVWRASTHGVGVMPATSSPVFWLYNNIPQYVRVTAGEILYIQVDGNGSEVGTLHYSWVLGPANDDFADAIVITGASGSQPVDLIDATLESGESSPVYGRGTVWFSWTCPSSGDYFLQSSGGADLILSVYTGFMTGALGMTNTTYGRKRFSFTAGTTYYIQVTTNNYYLYDAVNPSFTWGVAVSPPNDLFDNRTILTGTSGSVAFDTTDATQDPTPFPDGNGDIWFEWVAPSDAAIEFRITSSENPNTILGNFQFSVYEKVRRVIRGTMTGDPYRNGFFVGSYAVDRYLINPKAGVTYFISIRRTFLATGTLHWMPSTHPVDTQTFGTFIDLPTPPAEAIENVFKIGQNGLLSDPTIGIGRSTWRRWTAPYFGTLTLSAKPEISYDNDYPGVVVAAYSGPRTAASSAELTLLGTASDPATYSPDAGLHVPGWPNVADQPEALLTIPVSPGLTYYFQTDFLTFSNSPTISLKRTAGAAPPPNDTLGGATDLGTASGGSSGVLSTVGATVDVTDPGGGGTASVWAKWTAPEGNVRRYTFTRTGPTPGDTIRIYARRAPDPQANSDLVEVGRIEPFAQSTQMLVSPGQLLYFRVSGSSGTLVGGTGFTWVPGTEYRVGPWITPEPVEITGYGPVYPNGGQEAMVGTITYGHKARWVIDQQFGAPKYAYDFPDARQCALGHVQQGDTLYHYDWGWDFFTNSCAVGHYNDAIDVGFAGVGIEDDWDNGAPFVAAFYEMNMYQTGWALDFTNAYHLWTAGPTDDLDTGQIVETLTDPDGLGSHYSDAGYASTTKVFLNTIVEYDVNLAPGSAELETGITVSLSVDMATLIPYAYNGFTKPWFLPGDVSSHVDSVTLSAGQTVLPALRLLRRAGSSLRHAAGEGNDVNMPVRSRPTWDMFHLTSNWMTSGNPPPQLYTGATAPHTYQRDRAWPGALSVTVRIQGNPYRVLTPIVTNYVITGDLRNTDLHFVKPVNAS